jgi:hypothetical protein
MWGLAGMVTVLEHAMSCEIRTLDLIIRQGETND